MMIQCWIVIKKIELRYLSTLLLLYTMLILPRIIPLNLAREQYVMVFLIDLIIVMLNAGGV